MKNKYWKDKNVSDILKEVIEPDSVDVSTLQIHDELNPLIWENESLKPDVRKAMLLNAIRFIEFSNVENLKYDDIVLTGSMANYNYNEDSDIDIHIIMDFNQISDNTEFVGDFLKLKKQLWAENLPIQIKGHDTEMYFQDSSEKHIASGTYSIMNDVWLNKPIKKIINLNTVAIKEKSADFMDAIDDLGSNMDKNNWLKRYEILKDKIKKFRQSGLKKGGEYSIENLVFKILRNSGYLGKLIDYKNQRLKDELTLNEFGS
jgi:hypothetical protein